MASAWGFLRASRHGKLLPYFSQGDQETSNQDPRPGGNAAMPGFHIHANPLAQYSIPGNDSPHSNVHTVPHGPRPMSPVSTVHPETDYLARRQLNAAQNRQVLVLAAPASGKKKNWPVCQPVTYHNIDVEIPEGLRSVVRTAYATWCITAAGFVTNWLTVTVMMAWGAGGVDSLDWVLASVASGVGVPLSWRMWYWRLYKSARSGGRMDSVAFVVHVAFAIAWSLWTFVSVPQLGEMGAGMFPMLRAFAAGTTWLGLLCFLNVLLWALSAGLTTWLLRAVRTAQSARSIQFDAHGVPPSPDARFRHRCHDRGVGTLAGMRLPLMGGGKWGLFLRPCDRAVQTVAVHNGTGGALGGRAVPPVEGGDVLRVGVV